MQSAAANGEAMLSPAQCNWSAVVETNIPDSRSKTCAGALAPEGMRYLIGNQLPKLWDRAPHYRFAAASFKIPTNCAEKELKRQRPDVLTAVTVLVLVLFALRLFSRGRCVQGTR